MSRLRNVYGIKQVYTIERRIEREVKKRFPMKSVVALIMTLATIAFAVILLIAVAVDVSFNAKKDDTRVSASFSINAGMKNVTQVVDIVVPKPEQNFPPNEISVEITQPSTTTTSTSTTLKKERVYGVYHDGTLNWFDPTTGVGSRSTGETRCGK